MKKVQRKRAAEEVEPEVAPATPELTKKKKKKKGVGEETEQVTAEAPKVDSTDAAKKKTKKKKGESEAGVATEEKTSGAAPVKKAKKAKEEKAEQVSTPKEADTPKKKKQKKDEKKDGQEKETNGAGAPPPPKPSAGPTPVAKKPTKGSGPKPHVVFILESAGVAITNIGKKQNVVLCHDQHGTFLDAKRQPTWLFRPDIVHQALLSIFDTPLAKEGHVRVYVNTIKHKCIEISPTTRIPRTFKRFAGLMSQLIDQGKVINPETDQPLARVTRFPARTHIPEGRRVYGLCNTETLEPKNAYAFVKEVCAENAHHTDRGDPTAYFVISCRDNAAWPGEEEGFGEYVTDRVAITQYETSPIHLIGKISNAFEREWGV